MPSKKEYMLQWRAANKERLSMYSKEYKQTEAYKEAKRQSDAKYYERVRNSAEKMAARRERSKHNYYRNPEVSRSKARERTARYCQENREALAAKAKEAYWSKTDEERKALVEKRKEYQKQYRLEKNEQIKQMQAAWRQKNRDALLQQQKAAYEANRHAYIERAENRLRTMGERGKYTAADIQTLFTAQNGKCAACRLELANTRSRQVSNAFEVDHVMPLALGGMNTADNLQLLCRPCNRSKHAKHPDVWAAELGRLFA